jgi:NADPH:quinone reductase-like Zn-dependent oxidoreductase
MRGSPRVMRLISGIGKQKDSRFGFDLAGEIVAVGGAVTRFRAGDAVFGMCKGAFAEYVCAPDAPVPMSALAFKPASLTFEQAAAIPVAGFTALQGVRDKGTCRAGQTILINGAAGGVGTLAVQIAKALGAEVTGVCSTRNLDFIRSIGADRVIDYTCEDFTKGGRRYDIFFDCAGNRSLSAYRRVVNANGTIVIVAGPDSRWLGPLARFVNALALSRLVSQKLVPFVATTGVQDLDTLRELIDAGKVKPVIDRCYTLDQLADAIRYLEQGHARGKVVISI